MVEEEKAQAGLLAGLHIQEGKEMLDPAETETAAQLIDIVVTEVGGITAKIHSRGWGAQRSWKCRENISRK